MSTPTTDPRMETIENASRDDVIPGDHLTWTRVWERGDMTITARREGIAHHRDSDGDWITADGVWITLGKGEGFTLTIRRPIRHLPTKPGTVIVPADGHEFIEAIRGAYAYRTREAVLGADGLWHGVWRRDDGGKVTGALGAKSSTAPTWKVANQ